MVSTITTVARKKNAARKESMVCASPHKMQQWCANATPRMQHSQQTLEF